jgi:hypothetical protein
MSWELVQKSLWFHEGLELAVVCSEELSCPVRLVPLTYIIYIWIAGVIARHCSTAVVIQVIVKLCQASEKPW